MASIPCNYEVNVARDTGKPNWNGKGTQTEHFCRIELSQASASEAYAKFDIISQRFAAPQFKCTLTYWEAQGTQIASNYKEQQ